MIEVCLSGSHERITADVDTIRELLQKRETGKGGYEGVDMDLLQRCVGHTGLP